MEGVWWKDNEPAPLKPLPAKKPVQKEDPHDDKDPDWQVDDSEDDVDDPDDILGPAPLDVGMRGTQPLVCRISNPRWEECPQLLQPDSWTGSAKSSFHSLTIHEHITS